VHVLAIPGGGPPLTAGSFYGGAAADATIRIQLWYQSDSPEDPTDPMPVPDYPAEDIWLEAQGLVPCPGQAHADDDTDAEGWFTFSLPLQMGGWTDPEGGDPHPYIMVAGSPLCELNGPAIQPAILVNSPDLNADGQVNLSDVGLFSSDFYGAHRFRSDFFWDGVLNLADVGRLATGIGHECP
jgi:hypothetical protein